MRNKSGINYFRYHFESKHDFQHPGPKLSNISSLYDDRNFLNTAKPEPGGAVNRSSRILAGPHERVFHWYTPGFPVDLTTISG